jgi:DNA-binding FadR family transcriptional regulator
VAKISFEELTPVRFSEQIASRIEALVLSRALRPGDKLPSERELAESFGVSRPAVREALKLLKERGLVQARMGHGSFVAELGMDSVISSLSVASRLRNSTLGHLNEVRWNLEVHIAGLAAERATPEDLAKMETCLQAMEETIEDIPRFIREDMEFHAALAAATGNPIFLILSCSIIDLVQNMRLMLTTPVETALGQTFHKRLLDCIRRKDPSGAREAMQKHLEHVARLGCPSDLLFGRPDSVPFPTSSQD